MKKCTAMLLAVLCILSLANCGASSEPDHWSSVSEAILQSPAAKLETAGGQTAYVDGEISLLRTFTSLRLTAVPMEPADGPDDWIYRITFNPSEKVTGTEELVIAFHDAYVQIGTEYYLPEQDVPYQSIMEWVSGKFNYFLG